MYLIATQLARTAPMATSNPITVIKKPTIMTSPSLFKRPRAITEMPRAGIALVSGIGRATENAASKLMKPINCSQ